MQLLLLAGVIANTDAILKDMAKDFAQYDGDQPESERKNIVRLQTKYIKLFKRQLNGLRSINVKGQPQEVINAKGYAEKALASFVQYLEREQALLNQKRESSDETSKSLYAKAADFLRKAVEVISK